ncbi:MAG: hypothetical protein ACREJN_12115 [Nitrospiraceae bacterium]
MKMQRLNIQLPIPLKAKLDVQRQLGITSSGLIRHLLEQHFKGKQAAQRSRTCRSGHSRHDDGE